MAAKLKSNKKSGSNKKLPLNQSIPLGIQHVFAMFAGNITVPLIVAGVFGVTTGEKIFLIQMALFAAGVATIIQTVGYKDIGSRLPIIPVSYTHLRAHETDSYLVCRLLLEKIRTLGDWVVWSL